MYFFLLTNKDIFKNNQCSLPCEDVLGSVEDFIAGFGGFESALFLVFKFVFCFYKKNKN